MKHRGVGKIKHENSSGNVFADIGLPDAELLLADSKKRHKYKAQRTDCQAGHSHPSKAEARRCDELHLLQRAGEISRLEMQPKFPVSINGVKVFTYVADFAYFTRDARIVEDVKGQILPMYRLKKKCVEAYYAGVKIVEVR